MASSDVFERAPTLCEINYSVASRAPVDPDDDLHTPFRLGRLESSFYSGSGMRDNTFLSGSFYEPVTLGSRTPRLFPSVSVSVDETHSYKFVNNERTHNMLVFILVQLEARSS